MTAQKLLEQISAPLAERKSLPHTLVVVAHPDDEVIALGGRLPRYENAIFVHLTDGAPVDGSDAKNHGFASLDDYRDARRHELCKAFLLAGIPQEHDIQMQVPDQEAAFHLHDLSACVLNLMQSEKFEAVVTHPYEGGHPDHDACAFAVWNAASQLDGGFRPAILEAAFYHAGPDGIETGCFLPSAACSAVIERVLSPAEKYLKQQLLNCFSSQRKTLQYFGTDIEQFRIAPEYDFTQPPHPGKLFYEHFSWGITGKDFCALARNALCR
jgi:LmbE family N-acetylglucosaminyl deacetylase